MLFRSDGVVRTLTPGAVNAEVEVQTAQGLAVVAIVAQATVKELGLAPGAPVTALIKASDIVLAVID